MKGTNKQHNQLHLITAATASSVRLYILLSLWCRHFAQKEGWGEGGAHDGERRQTGEESIPFTRCSAWTRTVGSPVVGLVCSELWFC